MAAVKEVRGKRPQWKNSQIILNSEFELCLEDSVDSNAESEGELGLGWVILRCEGHSEAERRDTVRQREDRGREEGFSGSGFA